MQSVKVWHWLLQEGRPSNHYETEGLLFIRPIFQAPDKPVLIHRPVPVKTLLGVNAFLFQI
ncbi:hypothetical protein, partial [Kluyvera georgiana]|uniref:hypothetical protein n=1 Tax=Kluyvera georgiana TaxID=73098 RepID=UPI00321FBC9A